MSLADLFDLRGRAAIVTGGGAGLGLTFGEALAEAGANVLLCARHVERCQEATLAEDATRRLTRLGCLSRR